MNKGFYPKDGKNIPVSSKIKVLSNIIINKTMDGSSRIYASSTDSSSWADEVEYINHSRKWSSKEVINTTENS